MKKIRKRVNVIILMIVLVIGITGCDKNRFLNKNKIAREQCEIVLQCLDEDDVEGLKKIICYSTLETRDIGNQIDIAMDFFEGKTTSYEDITTSEICSYSNGKIEKLVLSSQIRNIVTDIGKEYEIFVSSYIICSEDREREGICEILIKGSGSECKIGDYIE